MTALFEQLPLIDYILLIVPVDVFSRLERTWVDIAHIYHSAKEQRS